MWYMQHPTGVHMLEVRTDNECAYNIFDKMSSNEQISKPSKLDPATLFTPITEALIRKRAEHNEGMVSNLEEVALHQQNIGKIELLGQLCPKLKILYLQNNLICKLQNLHKLKVRARFEINSTAYNDFQNTTAWGSHCKCDAVQ